MMRLILCLRSCRVLCVFNLLTDRAFILSLMVTQSDASWLNLGAGRHAHCSLTELTRLASHSVMLWVQLTDTYRYRSHVHVWREITSWSKYCGCWLHMKVKEMRCDGRFARKINAFCHQPPYKVHASVCGLFVHGGCFTLSDSGEPTLRNDWYDAIYNLWMRALGENCTMCVHVFGSDSRIYVAHSLLALIFDDPVGSYSTPPSWPSGFTHTHTHSHDIYPINNFEVERRLSHSLHCA